MTDIIDIRDLRRDYPRAGGIETVLGPLSLSIAQGSVVGIVGENGAGKSTLLRIIAGLAKPSAGTVEVRGKLGMVHQHFSLVPALSVAENVWLGKEPNHAGVFDSDAAAKRTNIVAERLFASPTNARPKVETLSVAAAQRVELMKALREEVPLVLLDEPTAVLVPSEIDALLGTIQKLKERGTTVLIVSHKLQEIASVCERVIILRRGALVLDAKLPETPLAQIAEAMIGQVPAEAEHLHTIDVQMKNALFFAAAGHALEVKAGEIRGIAGVAENGQEELFDALVSDGAIRLFGDSLKSAAKKRARGLRALPADRRRDALLPNASLFDNLRLGNPALTRERAQALLQTHDVRPPELALSVNALSGGNQQKLLFARELCGGGRVFVVHEPSRGIDFFAQASIWSKLRQEAQRGAAVIALSSDLDELRRHAHSVQVLYRGALSEPIDPRATDNRTLGARMAGLTEAS